MEIFVYFHLPTLVILIVTAQRLQIKVLHGVLQVKTKMVILIIGVTVIEVFAQVQTIRYYSTQTMLSRLNTYEHA